MRFLINDVVNDTVSVDYPLEELTIPHGAVSIEHIMTFRGYHSCAGCMQTT